MDRAWISVLSPSLQLPCLGSPSTLPTSHAPPSPQADGGCRPVRPALQCAPFMQYGSTVPLPCLSLQADGGCRPVRSALQWPQCALLAAVHAMALLLLWSGGGAVQLQQPWAQHRRQEGEGQGGWAESCICNNGKPNTDSGPLIGRGMHWQPAAAAIAPHHNFGRSAGHTSPPTTPSHRCSSTRSPTASPPAQILIDQAPSLFVLPPCHPCHTGAHRQIPVRPLPLHSSRSIPPPPPLPPAPLAYRYSSTRSRTARCATSCSLASRALRWRWGGGSTGGQMLWGLRQDTLIFTGGRIPSSSR